MTRRDRRALRIRRMEPAARPRVTRVWAPVSLLLLLLAPLALLIFPFVGLALWAHRIDPFRAAGHLIGLLASLSGTEVAVEGRRTNLRIKLV